ncbi:DUF397 domain-containing protein [Catellatospora citrea]|uniref:DUF397 domain-containing protein n=1 Tax=Catellatospora citrea TaxID=53366 RepID=A0A8J3KFR8_9ACTN|nr:DUF397 domain-containing protein [Catellatospora citrea]RKE07669.1 uncharacterized protein DUF397 [Catellatospora citrea]GIF99256.1 hypothetical protein Cci01nite_43500 [Catellatospora citrea]
MTPVHGLTWRKSRRCGESVACVEVSELGDAVGVRDSKAPDHHISLSIESFRSFITGVKNGEFDRV